MTSGERSGSETSFLRAVGRVVALDIGSKRIGVAACDPNRIVTRSVGMVPAEPPDRAIACIAAIVRNEEAVLVVAGLPLTLRGEIGPQAQRTAAFVERLRGELPVPVELYDERLTSSEAHRILSEERPVSREERRRGVVDQLAARLLLDDYLQEQRLASAGAVSPTDSGSTCGEEPVKDSIGARPDSWQSP